MRWLTGVLAFPLIFVSGYLVFEEIDALQTTGEGISGNIGTMFETVSPIFFLFFVGVVIMAFIGIGTAIMRS